MSESWLESAGALLGGLAASVAVGVTIWQYFVEKSRRKFELASRLIGQLEGCEMLAFAVTCVDWGDGLIPTPSSWQPIVGSPMIKQDAGLLGEALRFELSDRVRGDPTGMMYRHAFVALFNHLERVQRHVDEGSIRAKDLRSLAWLARELSHWSYAALAEIDPNRFFMEAAEGWYRDGVVKRLIDATKALEPPPSGRPGSDMTTGFS
ncbi:MAG: hypothetical protein ACREEB_01395 [Caulobacteraceae bacterium]